MNRELARAVRERAGGRCEYCRLPQFALPLPFQIDHIVAEQYRGETVPENLALACPHCNRYKGPNLAARDPASGELVRLFHPRTDRWIEHFRFEGAWIAGQSPVGRATVGVLAMNAEGPLRLRRQLAEIGASLF
ncbi:MAG: HNH endonuclease [Bryobacteraceae bacterium]